MKIFRVVVEGVVVVNKDAKIRKVRNKNIWEVLSEGGKNLGKFKSLDDAKKRLKQIEFFKHKSDNISDPNYIGGKPDFLEVEVSSKYASGGRMINNKKIFKFSNIDNDDQMDDFFDLEQSIDTSTSKTPFLKDIKKKDLSSYKETKSSDNNGELKSFMMELLFNIKAMEVWFHGAHHVTGGTGFSGDHVNLYSKIYEEISEDYDQAAEKGIGLVDESVACPVEISRGMLDVISGYDSPCNMDAESIARAGMDIVHNFLNLLEDMYNNLKKLNSLTLGLDDFIMSMANDYENIFYLLKQRCSD
jgi:hypothetical protein